MQRFAESSWRKASYSTSSQGCVEVAMTTSVVGVRDTKDRAGGTLVVPREHWRAFLRSITTSA